MHQQPITQIKQKYPDQIKPPYTNHTYCPIHTNVYLYTHTETEKEKEKERDETNQKIT